MKSFSPADSNIIVPDVFDSEAAATFDAETLSSKSGQPLCLVRIDNLVGPQTAIYVSSMDRTEDRNKIRRDSLELFR